LRTKAVTIFRSPAIALQMASIGHARKAAGRRRMAVLRRTR